METDKIKPYKRSNWRNFTRHIDTHMWRNKEFLHNADISLIQKKKEYPGRLYDYYSTTMKYKITVRVLIQLLELMVTDVIENNVRVNLVGYDAHFIVDVLPDGVFRYLRQKGRYPEVDVFNTNFKGHGLFMKWDIPSKKSTGMYQSYIRLNRGNYEKLVEGMNSRRYDSTPTLKKYSDYIPQLLKSHPVLEEKPLKKLCLWFIKRLTAMMTNKHNIFLETKQSDFFFKNYNFFYSHVKHRRWAHKRLLFKWMKLNKEGCKKMKEYNGDTWYLPLLKQEEVDAFKNGVIPINRIMFRGKKLLDEYYQFYLHAYVTIDATDDDLAIFRKIRDENINNFKYDESRAKWKYIQQRTDD